MRKWIALLCLLGMLISLLPGGAGASELNPEPKDATEITAQINQSVYEQLDFDDQQELAFAQKGYDPVNVFNQEGFSLRPFVRELMIPVK